VCRRAYPGSKSGKNKHELNMHKAGSVLCNHDEYDDSYKGVKVVYDKDNIRETLGGPWPGS